MDSCGPWVAATLCNLPAEIQFPFCPTILPVSCPCFDYGHVKGLSLPRPAGFRNVEASLRLWCTYAQGSGMMEG